MKRTLLLLAMLSCLASPSARAATINSLNQIPSVAGGDELEFWDISAASGSRSVKGTIDQIGTYLYSTTATLSNKTINADNNTITNIGEGEIDFGTGSGEISIADFLGDQISPALVWDFGGSTSLQLPHSGAPTTDALGEIALDDTITDHQPMFQYFDGSKNMTLIAIDTSELPALDDEIIKYDAATDRFVLEADAGGSGSVATDTIWDAAGDLAVGSGADTASKLTMGSALQVLRVNSGATGLEWAAAAGGVTTRTAIVRVGAAGTWTLLDNAEHTPLGIASIAQDSGAKTITLTYDTAIVGKVYSASCDVDETLAGTFDAGVSVGSTTAIITIRAIGGARGRVYRSGGSWTFDVKDSSNVAWSPTGWSGADDHYRLDDCPDWLFMSGVIIGTRQSTFLASNKATNNTNGAKRVDIDFRDYDGTLQTNQQDGMGFNIYIPPLTTDIDPALINSVDFTDGNIWVTILSED